MMMPLLSELWKDPVWSKVISGLILAGFGSLLFYFKGWWPRIYDALRQAIAWPVAKTRVPNWLSIALSILALGFVRRFIVMRLRSKPAPDFLSYTTDTWPMPPFSRAHKKDKLPTVLTLLWAPSPAGTPAGC